MSICIVNIEIPSMMHRVPYPVTPNTVPEHVTHFCIKMILYNVKYAVDSTRRIGIIFNCSQKYFMNIKLATLFLQTEANGCFIYSNEMTIMTEGIVSRFIRCK